jgi:hypothetical protein
LLHVANAEQGKACGCRAFCHRQIKAPRSRSGQGTNIGRFNNEKAALTGYAATDHVKALRKQGRFGDAPRMSGRLGIDKKQAVDFGLAGFIDKPARLHFDQSVDLLDAT